jgi:hypothetical protein
MKLVNFFEHSKPGSGFQEPSESGCLGKQIKKGKAKKTESKLNEYKYYMVKGPKGFKEKILAGSESDAKTKARHLAYRQGKASVGASRFSGSSDSDFEIMESNLREDIDLSDKMIGQPDDYFDEEERKEAYADLKDAMDDCRRDYEKSDVMQGVCPNCSGTGYQDAEYPDYDDDGEEIEDSAYECDGWGMFGCDDGEMMGASWCDIVKHDERNAERKKAQDNYPGDEEVINQIARAVKQMDDPRQMFQYMQADYPFMGRAQRSDLIAKGMKKAGLTSESLNEGEERSIISNACVEKLVDEFGGREHQFENKDDFEYAIYQELEDLDVEDCVDPDMEVGGQRIGDFASGRVIDCCSSGDIIYDVMQNMDLEQIGEGRIEDTFGTKTIDKHDKPEKDKKKKDEDIDLIKKLSGIKTEGRPFQNLDLADIVKLPNGKEYVFKPEKGMFVGTDGTYPGGPEEVDPSSRAHRELIRLRKNQAARLKGVKEDADGDASEVAVSKMIAKALGDENRWTEMSAAELYAELESENTDMADIVKDVAKMIYGVRLAENKTKYHDSSECSCKCGKPVCGACGRPHRPEDIKEGEGDFYNKLMNLMHDEEAYAKACGLSDEQLDQEMSEIARDRGLHMDDDREAIIMKHAEDKEEEKNKKVKEEITLEDTQDFHEEFGILGFSIDESDMFEAEYQGRKVKLNKPMRGDVKKFKVYVKDPKTGNVKKVNFGHGGTSAKRKTMRIRKSNPKARKSFRARHNCDNPGPKTKARYWSCRKW